MKKTITGLTLMLALIVTGSVAASEIYMHRDKDGNVQYRDRPSEGAVRITNIKSQPTNHRRLFAAAHARQEQQAHDAVTAARAPQGQSEEERRAATEERTRMCQNSRGHLDQLVASRRLYRENDAGDREYLSEDEMQVARDKMRSQVEEYCSS